MKFKNFIIFLLISSFLLFSCSSTSKKSSNKDPLFVKYSFRFLIISSVFLSKPLINSAGKLNHLSKEQLIPIYRKNDFLKLNNNYLEIIQNKDSRIIKYTIQKIQFEGHIIDLYKGQINLEILPDKNISIVNTVENFDISDFPIEIYEKVKIDEYLIDNQNINLTLILNKIPLGTRGNIVNNSFFQRLILPAHISNESNVKYDKVQIKEFLNRLEN